MTLTFIILSSAIAASFFGMLIYRLNNNISLVKPAQSICPLCKHKLNVLDLIPLFSYLICFGRCRYCRKKIDPMYFMLEVLFVVVGVLGYFYKLPILTLLLYLILIVVLCSDFKYQEIPYLFMGLTAVFAFWSHYNLLLANISNLIFVLAFFVLIKLVEKYYYRREVFGGADILLFGIFALYFPRPSFFLLVYLSFIIGAVLAGFLMLLKKIDSKSIVPFAPFMVLAFYCTEFFGPAILKYYAGLFHV